MVYTLENSILGVKKFLELFKMIFKSKINFEPLEKVHENKEFFVIQKVAKKSIILKTVFSVSMQRFIKYITDSVFRMFQKVNSEGGRKNIINNVRNFSKKSLNF
jgi:hypothetical protein